MTGTKKTTTVGGRTYTYWSDFMDRSTYAQDDAGNVKRICGGSYLRNDLTARKAIAVAFQLPSFRK